jgi:hypothetical protein
MNKRFRVAVQFFLAALAASLLVGGTAGAATVVNGDFETGNLSGWTQSNNPSGESQTGEWITYTGAFGGEIGGELPPPPAGSYAALTVQGGPGQHILYQDVSLEPYFSHQLTLVAYYDSANTLVTPQPNTLSPGESEGGPPENQQYRIDVMKPTAAIESVETGDILATVFATKSGDPTSMAPTTFTADLSPFAGQTVRLRFAEVDNIGELNAGVDAVAIQSTPPSNAITLGKPVFNKKKGTARLPVTVPGPGTLTVADVKLTGKRIKGRTVQTTAAGTVNLPINPTKPARNTLVNQGKKKLKVAVSFTPTGGFLASATRKLTLKLAPKK